MEELRREITQYQASIIDLMKWKLILIGSIGAVGLGLTDKGSADHPGVSALILCVIPFACNYVDALCKNLQLKICRRRVIMGLIGEQVITDDESLIRKAEFGKSAIIEEDERILWIFTLQEMVLTLSTATINAGLMLYALLFRSEWSPFIVAAALTGVLFMFYVEIIYRLHMKRVVHR